MLKQRDRRKVECCVLPGFIKVKVGAIVCFGASKEIAFVFALSAVQHQIESARLIAVFASF